ncbi:hypothetical protein DQ238_00180 [Geodermatophilus sp. TF02-6]|nr:hypothetical protein DQ238_00180 [Geodermatophilus sp. TF02-6]
MLGEPLPIGDTIAFTDCDWTVREMLTPAASPCTRLNAAPYRKRTALTLSEVGTVIAPDLIRQR